MFDFFKTLSKDKAMMKKIGADRKSNSRNLNNDIQRYMEKHEFDNLDRRRIPRRHKLKQ